MNKLGLYFHVPFCRGKCPYCDFYSLAGTPEGMDAYVAAVLRAMAPLGGEAAGAGDRHGILWRGYPQPAGGGAAGPAAAGGEGGFCPGPRAEVTLEANPTQVDRAFFQGVREAGFDRLSMGLQSANEEELRLLGRAHSPRQAARAVEDARAAGFSNISLDLMLGLPGGSREKLGGPSILPRGWGWSTSPRTS